MTLNQYILKNSLKEYKKNFNLYFISIIPLLFGLISSTFFFLLFVFSSNLSFSPIVALFLFAIFFYFFVYHGFLETVFLFHTIKYNNLEIKKMSLIKVLSFGYKSSFTYFYLKGSFKIFSVLLKSILIYLILSSILVPIGISIAYNTNGEVKSFLDTFNELVKEHASYEILMDYYFENGGVFDEAMKVINVIVTSIPILFFIHTVIRNTVHYDLRVGIIKAPIPAISTFMLFKRLIKSNRETYYKSYYFSNGPILFIFYLSYFVTAILLSFFSNSFLFILACSVLISLFILTFFLPIILDNNNRINISFQREYSLLSYETSLDGLMRQYLKPNLSDEEKKQLDEIREQLINAYEELKNENNSDDKNDKNNDDLDIK